MAVTTYEGIVQNGTIKLPESVQLPEHSRVYVVVPDKTSPSVDKTTPPLSPRLVHPEEISDFAMEICLAR